MRPICFYHKADLDGVCSGAIVKHFVPDVELVGYDYGQPFPWEKVFNTPRADTGKTGDTHTLYADDFSYWPKRTVYMVDVSLPPEDMKRLAKVSNLVWIDHHASIINQMAGFEIDGYQVVGAAGCELCWVWFESRVRGLLAHEVLHLLEEGCNVPEAVRLLGRYDVWDKDHPDWESKILPFQYGLRTQKDAYDPLGGAESKDPANPDGLSLWEELFAMRLNLNAIVRDGRMILRYQAEVNRRAMETGAHEFKMAVPRTDHTPTGMMTPDGYLRVLACNTIVFNSLFFDGFYDPTKHDVMCAYCQLASGKWKVSLYTTKPELDCGAICKTFGGGGHKGAAGFICDNLPWEK